jgi:hypothetical protein
MKTVTRHHNVGALRLKVLAGHGMLEIRRRRGGILFNACASPTGQHSLGANPLSDC